MPEKNAAIASTARSIVESRPLLVHTTPRHRTDVRRRHRLGRTFVVNPDDAEICQRAMLANDTPTATEASLSPLRCCARRRRRQSISTAARLRREKLFFNDELKKSVERARRWIQRGWKPLLMKQDDKVVHSFRSFGSGCRFSFVQESMIAAPLTVQRNGERLQYVWKGDRLQAVVSHLPERSHSGEAKPKTDLCNATDSNRPRT